MHVISGMGYCGSVIDGEPRDVSDYIPEAGPVTADQFVEWVFLAEGLDHIGSAHAEQMRTDFVELMGSDVVEANALQYALVTRQSSSSS
jgi:hypothetical protein